MAGARIVFEPTAYDGCETSPVNCILEASEKEVEAVRSWEQSADGAKALRSALAPNGFKVKIDKTTGRRWEDKTRTTLPQALNDKACNANMQWAGAWEAKA